MRKLEKSGRAMDERHSDIGTLLKCTRDIVGAYVGNNPVPASDLPALIDSIFGVLRSLSSPSILPTPTMRKPAVPIQKSITPGYIVCLEDGKHLKMLKRYLLAQYGMSPKQYRAKWRLPIDYPMIAPNYAAVRSGLARKISLGHYSRIAKRRRKRETPSS